MGQRSAREPCRAPIFPDTAARIVLFTRGAKASTRATGFHMFLIRFSLKAVLEVSYMLHIFRSVYKVITRLCRFYEGLCTVCTSFYRFSKLLPDTAARIVLSTSGSKASTLATGLGLHNTLAICLRLLSLVVRRL